MGYDYFSRQLLMNLPIMDKLLSIRSVLMLSFFLAAGVSLSVAQAEDPTPEERAYKFRTSLFQTFGFKYGKLIGSKMKGDEAMFKKHAADLAYLTTMLEEGFEIENSLPEGTEAKAKIWDDFSKFEEKADTLRAAVAELQNDGAMEEFNPRNFGSKNCGGCHREFRIKKN